MHCQTRWYCKRHSKVFEFNLLTNKVGQWADIYFTPYLSISSVHNLQFSANKKVFLAATILLYACMEVICCQCICYFAVKWKCDYWVVEYVLWMQTTWLVTAAAVILTDVGIGLAIGVAFSLISIVFRTQMYCDLALLFVNSILYKFIHSLTFNIWKYGLWRWCR